jgi:hypothetical protein
LTFFSKFWPSIARQERSIRLACDETSDSDKPLSL